MEASVRIQSICQQRTESAAIRCPPGKYAQAVDTVDLRLLAQIWSHSPDVWFIDPFGEEHSFEAIEEHVFEKVMGAMFSALDLKDAST